MVLQRYRATKELGKGSFGTVYLTEGRRDKRPYVVKVVDNLRENNLKVQEIRVMMHLKHRNIVEMCDFYTSNNQLCIVMEYADGGDLRKEILKARQTKTSISEELITIWLIQVCQALDYAHDEQIIHRDIKPSNIFLQADGKTVKVGDFGISRVLDAASGRDQMAPPDAEGRVGTKRYMAPEVLNKQDYSNKADIWSLGCVLFELLTLNHPTYEPDRRIWFEWIPPVYSQSMNQIIRSMLSERAIDRPSPKELLVIESDNSELTVKLATPYVSSPSVQQDFVNTMQWYDQRLTQQRQLFESQAQIIRQFVKNQRIAPVAPMAPAPLTPQGGSGKDLTAPLSNPPRAASASEENLAGTGLVLGISSSGTVKVINLVGGGRAEASRQVDVGDVIHEVDGVALNGKYSELPLQQLRGRGGESVRIGLLKPSGKVVNVTLPVTSTPGVESQGSLNGSAKNLSVTGDRSIDVSQAQHLAPPSPSAEDLEHFNIPEYIEDAEVASQDDTPPAAERVPSQNITLVPTPVASSPGDAGASEAANSAATTVLPDSTQPSSTTSTVSKPSSLSIVVAPPNAEALAHQSLTPSPLPRAGSTNFVAATPHDVPPAPTVSPQTADPAQAPAPASSPKVSDASASQQRSATGAQVTTQLTQPTERDAAYTAHVQQPQPQPQASQQVPGLPQRTSSGRDVYGAAAAAQQQQQQQQRSHAYAPQLIQAAPQQQPQPQQQAVYQHQQQHVALTHQQHHPQDYLSHRQPQANSGVYSDYPRHQMPPQQHQMASVPQGYMPGASGHNIGYAHAGYDRFGQREQDRGGLGRSFDGRRDQPSSPKHQHQQQSLRSSFQADAATYQPQTRQSSSGYQQMQPQQQPTHTHSYALHPVNSWQGSGVSEQAQHSSMRSSADGREASAIAQDVLAGRSAASLGRSLDAASMRRVVMGPAGEGGGGGYTSSMKQQPPPQRFGATDTDTSKVLQELERVRSGIQETLAKAAAAGKLGEGAVAAPPSQPLSYGAQPTSFGAPGQSGFPGGGRSVGGMEQAGQAPPPGFASSQGGAGQYEDQATGSKYSFAEL